MKRIWKNAFCLLLVLALLCGAAVAEGFDATQAVTIETMALPMPELPLVDEPITFSVMFPRQSAHGDFDDMWFIKKVAEMTGITMKIEAVESSGINEKVNLSFASNDLTDLYINCLDYSKAATYGMAGMLVDMKDMLYEYSPNSVAIFDYVDGIVKDVTALDGGIYTMPAFNTTARDMVNIVGFINEAWLAKAGLSVPKTLNELYDALVAIKNGDGNDNGEADEIPLSFIYSGDSNNATLPILTAFGFVNPRHDVINDQYVYVPMQENFRHYLSFMNKLWEEDLLDHEIFTQTSEQYAAKITEYILGMESGQVKDYFSDIEKTRQYVMIGPMTSEYNDKPMWAASPAAAGQTMSISTECPDPVAAVKLLDFFYSEEASFMIKCGPEKGTWEGEGGWARVTNDDGTESYVIDINTEKYNSYWNFRLANGLMQMPFFYTDAHAAVVLGADIAAKLTSEQVFTSGSFDVRRLAYPSGVTFTEDEQDTLAVYVLLDSYVDRMVAQFITGEIDIDDDAQWQSYLDNIDMMDVQTMIDVRQEAYDRWNKD